MKKILFFILPLFSFASLQNGVYFFKKKDYKKALKMTGQILDILDDIEMEWNLYADYNK